MSSCSVTSVVRALDSARAALDEHSRDCGDRVVGVALHPVAHGELAIVELWGLPVLAWEEVSPGKLRLLCDAQGVLIPPVDTCEELLDRWQYHLEGPVASGPPLSGIG
jgi:hypothetical protein